MLLGGAMHGGEAGMNKKPPLLFKISPHSGEKTKVPGRLDAADPCITLDGSPPPMEQPIRIRPHPSEPFLAPGVVVAANKNAIIGGIQFHQELHHLPRFRPPIHIIAQKDEPVLRLSCNPPDHLLQCPTCPPNIADNICSCHFLSGIRMKYDDSQIAIFRRYFD